MKVADAIWSWYSERKLRWIADLGEIPTEEMSVVRLRGHSGLVPLPGGNGAILLWVFDHRDGANPLLIVRLTETEANAVFEADPFKTGMIEPVRRKIQHRWAWMAVRCGRRQYIRPYRIPRFVGEESFVASLDSAADSCPAYHFTPTITRSTDEIRATYRVVRQLSFA